VEASQPGHHEGGRGRQDERRRQQGGRGAMDMDNRRPEMDRREVALELVKLGATTGFIPKSDKPEFVTLLKSYTQAFEAVIESERTPMLRK